MSQKRILPNTWNKIEFSQIATLAKKKFNPLKEQYEKICVELEHIEKETGCLLDTISSKDQLSIKNVFKSGDVLFGKLRPNLKKYIHCKFDGVCSSEIWVLSALDGIHSKFLFYLVQQEKFIRSACITSGSKMPRADWNVVSGIPCLVPSLSEQIAIADMLSIWDEAIETTQRLMTAKKQHFKQLLKDLIHRGRMDHEWKGYSLGELCYPISRKNTENDTNVLTSSAQNGLISQLDYYNRSVSAENVTAYYLLKKGEFAYNRSSAKGYPYGAIKRLDRYKQGVLSTLYLCFALKPEAPCESDFLLHLFESGAANRELRAVCQEGARSHGLLNITKSDFFGIKIFLPNQEQQKRIQHSLNTAQSEINLLKQLIDKYKTQKRGLMQKILTGQWRIKPEIVNKYAEI